MNGQRVGYKRVSSIDQNPVRQLEGVPLDRTFTDKVSGKNTERPRLQEMLEYIREGDTVLVHSLDRLAHNLVDLHDIVKTIAEAIPLIPLYAGTSPFSYELLAQQPSLVGDSPSYTASASGTITFPTHINSEGIVVQPQERRGFYQKRAEENPCVLWVFFFFPLTPLKSVQVYTKELYFSRRKSGRLAIMLSKQAFKKQRRPHKAPGYHLFDFL